MRIRVSSSAAPHQYVDVTDRVIIAIAQGLSAMLGGALDTHLQEARAQVALIAGRLGAGAADSGESAPGLGRARTEPGTEFVPACPGCPRRRAAANKLGDGSGVSRVGLSVLKPASVAHAA